MQYLTRAGQQALNRSAFAEAQAQLQQGLEWIKKLPESPERDARELELASTLAQVLLVTRGFTAPETRAAAERARDLAEKGGNLAQLVAQVFGIWRSVIVAGDYSTGGPAGGPDTRPRPARGQSRELWLRLPCSGGRELLFAATSPAPRSTSRAGAASLTRMVSGKFPARPLQQSVSQAFARGPWVTPIQPASALPGRSPSHGIATTPTIWRSGDALKAGCLACCENRSAPRLRPRKR